MYKIFNYINYVKKILNAYSFNQELIYYIYTIV